jgi:acetoin utilization deacetylase AcuC-like enzyme
MANTADAKALTLFYYDPVFLEHETGQHPEQPARVGMVARNVLKSRLAPFLTRPTWQPASLERITRVHTSRYASEAAEFAAHGGDRIEEDTPVSSRSFEVARHAAGAVCDAVERVLGGQDQRAFCLVRPPGHHALAAGAMGFCLLNNVAVGARVALAEFDLNRVLIVDWDVHHGNGTQAVFWEDEQAGFLSIHRWPFYPGTGAADETGSGPALGTKLNLPIEFGTPRRQFMDRFRSGLESLAAKIRPELVLVSAGFDAHRDDPIGSLELETEDFIPLTRMVLDVADTYAGGRLVSVLEGGYNLAALVDSVDVHLQTLVEHPSK